LCLQLLSQFERIIVKYFHDLKFIIPVGIVVFEVVFWFPTATVTVAGAYVACGNSLIALACFYF
jgi:hypothetical protein